MLLWLVFPYDTPVYEKQQGRTENLNIIMNKIYATPEIAAERIDEIKIISEDDQKDLTYSKLCCDKQYSRATIVGCLLSVFQTLTGINVIMFYSNMVFKGLTMSATTVTALIGIVNFVATIIGFFFLICFGRKTIMLVFNILMALSLFLIAYFSFMNDTYGMVACTLLFIIFFEFSSGPILWLYLAEILQDKAQSIATFLNWSINLAISVSVPLMVKSFAIGYIFLGVGVITVFGVLFIIFFMKETKGKT